VGGGKQKEWAVYDIGSKHVRCPLICMPPVSGRADVFFKQLLAMSAAGYRVIAVSQQITSKLLYYFEVILRVVV